MFGGRDRYKPRPKNCVASKSISIAKTLEQSMQIRVWTCPCTVALPSPSPNSKAHFLICLNFPSICSSNVICNQFLMKNSTAIKALSASNNGDEVGDRKNGMAKASGTSARGRRLLKLREEKRRREHERLNTYPAWAKVLEDGCKHDAELRAVLGDSIGNPEEMRKRVEERVRKKGRDFYKSKTGSVLAFKVSFRDFNPLDSYIWVELLGSPTDRDVYLLGSVIQAWYVMGRLGAFNSSNLQLANCSMEYNPLYDAEKAMKVMPSSFHDISDVEFQDNWGRFWVDLGTADVLAIDVLLNCLTVLSSEYLGIQQVVFGGRNMGDWEEGMISPEYGYKSFKI